MMKNQTLAQTIPAMSATPGKGKGRGLIIAKALAAAGILKTSDPVTARSAAWLLLMQCSPTSDYKSLLEFINRSKIFFSACDAAGHTHVLALLEMIMREGPGQVEAVMIEPWTLFAMVKNPAGIFPVSTVGAQEPPAVSKPVYLTRAALQHAHEIVIATQAALN